MYWAAAGEAAASTTIKPRTTRQPCIPRIHLMASPPAHSRGVQDFWRGESRSGKARRAEPTEPDSNPCCANGDSQRADGAVERGNRLSVHGAVLLAYGGLRSRPRDRKIILSETLVPFCNLRTSLSA